MSWAGPDGAATTARLEAMIEGLEDCEAAVALAEGIEKHKAKLDPALAERAARLLDERLRYRDLAWTEYENRSYSWPVVHPHHFGWQDLRKRTYDCAAEISKALGRK